VVPDENTAPGEWQRPACCTALDDSDICEHKKRFFRMLEFLQSQNIPVGFAPDGVQDQAFRIARVHLEPSFCIDLWPTAYMHYGWDVVTSALIHEFGHCKLYEIEKRAEVSLDVERLANEYGRTFTPADLIPEDYDHHRKCSLWSYEANREWTAEEWLTEWRRMYTTRRKGTAS
jgi:hypothetical protein